MKILYFHWEHATVHNLRALTHQDVREKSMANFNQVKLNNGL